MSTYTNPGSTDSELGVTSIVGRTAAAGIVAGLVFGVLIQFRLERMTAIGAMYTLGDPSLATGWVSHLFHSAVFGAFYGLLADTNALREYARNLLPGLALGAAYATVLWAVNIVFVWPLWLNSVGFGADVRSRTSP